MKTHEDDPLSHGKRIGTDSTTSQHGYSNRKFDIRSIVAQNERGTPSSYHHHSRLRDSSRKDDDPKSVYSDRRIDQKSLLSSEKQSLGTGLSSKENDNRIFHPHSSPRRLNVYGDNKNNVANMEANLEYNRHLMSLPRKHSPSNFHKASVSSTHSQSYYHPPKDNTTPSKRETYYRPNGMLAAHREAKQQQQTRQQKHTPQQSQSDRTNSNKFPRGNIPTDETFKPRKSFHSHSNNIFHPSIPVILSHDECNVIPYLLNKNEDSPPPKKSFSGTSISSTDTKKSFSSSFTVDNLTASRNEVQTTPSNSKTSAHMSSRLRKVDPPMHHKPPSLAYFNSKHENKHGNSHRMADVGPGTCMASSKESYQVKYSMSAACNKFDQKSSSYAYVNSNKRNDYMRTALPTERQREIPTDQQLSARSLMEFNANLANQMLSRKDFGQGLSSSRQLQNYLGLATAHAGGSPAVPPALNAAAQAQAQRQAIALHEALKHYTNPQYIANASAAIRVGSAGQRPSQGIPFATADANILASINPYLLAGMATHTLPYTYTP